MKTETKEAAPQELLGLAAQAFMAGPGEAFFQDLVRYLAEGFGASYTLVGEVLPDAPKRVNVLASWKGGAPGQPFVYPLEGAPCENVIGRGTCWYCDGVATSFPRDIGLAKNHIASYVGTPLFASDGRTLGLIAVMDERPREENADLRAFLSICANRAGLELERLQAKARSERSEHFARRIVDTSPSVIYVYDLQRQQNIYWNRQFAEQLGYTGNMLEELGPDFFTRIVHPDDFARLPDADRWNRTTDNEVLSTEYRMKSADGEWRWFLSSDAVFQRDETGKVIQILGTAFDITPLKHAQQALARRERDYRALFEQADDGIFIATEDRQIIEVNPAGCRMFGYTHDELRSMRTDEMIAPEELQERPLRFPEHEPEGYFIMERVLRRKDGTRFLAEVSARMLEDGRRQAIVRNVEERRKLEAQLRQSQKMELVGQLAGGVAHDLNNMLQAISGFAAIAQTPENVAERREAISEILAASARARDLTRQLLAFGRRQTLKLAVTDLSVLVEGLLRMLRRLIGSSVELAFQSGGDIGLVRCDPTQIEQVVMNLCVNARDAMPEGGKVNLSLAPSKLTEAELKMHPNASPGRFVRLTVADNGEGIPPENLERIFEPFFSTRPQRAGTGLGLAVVQGIVEQHGGIVRVHSELGEGTTFEVFLPEVEAPEHAAPPRPEPQSSAGKHTLLVAEDDDAVRSLLVRVLERSGFRILVATDGSEAVDTFLRHVGEIDAAVLDVMMPALRGQDVLTRIREHQPELPAILCSGYARALSIPVDELPENTLLLQKPFEIEELIRSIRRFVR